MRAAVADRPLCGGLRPSLTHAPRASLPTGRSDVGTVIFRPNQGTKVCQTMSAWTEAVSQSRPSRSMGTVGAQFSSN